MDSAEHAMRDGISMETLFKFYFTPAMSELEMRSALERLTVLESRPYSDDPGAVQILTGIIKGHKPHGWARVSLLRLPDTWSIAATSFSPVRGDVVDLPRIKECREVIQRWLEQNAREWEEIIAHPLLALA